MQIQWDLWRGYAEAVRVRGEGNPRGSSREGRLVAEPGVLQPFLRARGWILG